VIPRTFSSSSSLHDNAACLQLPDDLRQKLPSQLLDLVLRLLLVVLLAMMLLAIMLRTMWLLVTLLMTAAVPALVTAGLLRQRRRRADLPTGQIDVHPPLVRLGGIVEAHLPAHLLDAGLDPLHVAGAVVAPAHDDMQMPLAPGLGVADACLEDVLGLLDVLPVQVDGVAGYASLRVVLPEDELGRLLVVSVLLRRVPLALVREGFCRRAIPALICLVCLRRGLARPRVGKVCVPATALDIYTPYQSMSSSLLLPAGPGRGDGRIRPLRHCWGYG